VVKCTAIEPERSGHRRRLPQNADRLACSLPRAAAIEAVKAGEIQPRRHPGARRPRAHGHRHGGDFQLTSALKYLSYGKQIALIHRARFSGVSTGACIGHVSPEALAGGPIGKLRDGDMIEIVIDRVRLEGRINLAEQNAEKVTG
jgi:dihydroxyacid dehydratase/phosphogluconate dehydratase